MRKQLLFILLMSTLLTGCINTKTGMYGEVENAKAVAALPRKAFRAGFASPESASLRKFCPPAMKQVGGTCFACATAYAARTILYNVTAGESRDPGKNAFSNGFMVALLQPLSPSNKDCSYGYNAAEACESISVKGVALKSDVPGDCLDGSVITPAIAQLASKYRANDALIFDESNAPNDKIAMLKQSVAANRPVVISWKVARSFNYVNTESWVPGRGETFLAKITRKYGHAICVVAYDDKKNGGSFQIMNSWSDQFGDRGFCWIRYSDFTSFAGYGVELSNN